MDKKHKREMALLKGQLDWIIAAMQPGVVITEEMSEVSIDALLQIKKKIDHSHHTKH